MYHYYLIRLFLHSIPESVALIYCSSMILRQKISYIPLFEMAFFHSLIIIVLRKSPGIIDGVHTVVSMFLLIYILFSILSSSLIKCTMATLYSYAILTAGEIFCITLMREVVHYFTQDSLFELMELHSLLFNLLALPQVLILVLTGFTLDRFWQKEAESHLPADSSNLYRIYSGGAGAEFQGEGQDQIRA